jgi:ATP-dependent Clp protease ATP-binding subunit ClpA
VPILSRDLERAVRRCVVEAARRGHEGATLEHLLHAFTEAEEGAALLDACGVDRALLRAGLERLLDAAPPAPVRPVEPRATEAFSRAMQRASIHCQASGRAEVGCAHVVVAMFSERRCPAPWLLGSLGVTRPDAIDLVVRERPPAGDGQP